MIAALIILSFLFLTARSAARDKDDQARELNDSACLRYAENPCVLYNQQRTSESAQDESRQASGDSRRSTTPLRARVRADSRRLQEELSRLGSPLAAEAELLAESPYWSTILGICSIEQYNCTKAPYNNYWGLMGGPGGGLQRFETLADGIAAIDRYLTRQESYGRTTIESFRGFYCQDATQPGRVCPNWEPHVLDRKDYFESLTQKTWTTND